MKNTEPTLLLYEKIADSLERQILEEVLKAGDKLPSVRTVCRQHQVSMSTALQAYYQLEAKSLIEAKPQSGYYVSYSHKKMAIHSIGKQAAFKCKRASGG